MADELFIRDGYTRIHTFASEPGKYPGCTVEFRPALNRDRTAYGVAMNTKDADRIERFEVDLIVRHQVSIDGEKLDKEKAGILVPDLRAKLLDLILGYTAAEEVKDAKN